MSQSAPHKASGLRCRRRRVAQLLGAVCLVALLPTSGPFCLGQQQQTKQQQQKQPIHSQQQQRPLAEEAASINLKSILTHQQALLTECNQLQVAKLRQLKQVIDFDRDNPHVHLPNALPVKLPAVCLLLFGPPDSSLAAATEAAAAAAVSSQQPHLQQQQQQQPPPPQAVGLRLDLVNWIYDPNELVALADQHHSAAGNMSKREAGDQAPEVADAAQLDSNGLLNSYFFDLSQAAASEHVAAGSAASPLDGSQATPVTQPSQANSAQQQNEIGGGSGATAAQNADQMDKFHEQVGKLLVDERFRQAIDADRTRFTPYLSPVVLVPGLLGSRLQGRIVHKTQRINIFCSKQSDWQDLWLSLRMFLPLMVDCWLDNVRLEIDPLSGAVKQPEGVEVRVPDFGSLDSVRHLDLRSPKLTAYFEPIIRRYEQLGYTPNTNLFAAPYDFRLAPPQLERTYFVHLRKLVELAQAKVGQQSAATSNGGAAAAGKVTFVCHSMGCTNLLVFLRQQSAAWRQSRVRKVIALSSPWAGSVKALKALVVGDQLDLPLVSEVKMRRLARTYPSIAYLLPQAQVFEAPNRQHADFGGPTLVEIEGQTYKVKQMPDLLRRLNLTTQLEWFEQTAPLIRPLEPLADVHVDCIHSLNIPTPEKLLFKSEQDFPNGEYELISGEGDGTVNYQSLLVCDEWARKLPNKVKHKIIMNTNHLGVLSHETTLMHITDDVLITTNQ